MERKKILVSRLFPEVGLDLLEQEGFELTRWSEDRPMTPAELVDNCQGHQALFCTVTEAIDRKFLEQCRHLDIISQFAVGYDNIDVNYATSLGIPIGNTPDVMTEATADIAFGLMIATARKMFFNHKLISNGEWGYFRPKGHLGMELAGKTLGVFGMGRIGMAMARRCRGAYNMNILYCSRSSYPKAEKNLGARKVELKDLLGQSDVVSVHCPLTPETYGIFDEAAFKQMKSSAIFINTARGPVHNQVDLIAALASGEIRGAGLDVTDPEPMDRNNPLLSMENACVLPHIGSATREARNGMSRLAAENIIEFYQTGSVPHVVNPQVLRRQP
ncbi:MAG: D-glycerate dehydrogenase [Thermodesulfobacteriota bacterium]|nr:D-glycerate dehydrogenase [Thermodesulfobacteriota bacterium]